MKYRFRDFRGENYTKYWLLFWGLIFTISFFIIVKPFNYIAAEKNDFNVKTSGVKVENKWSEINQDKPNYFFAHPGEIEPVILELKSNISGKYKIEFSIKQGSKAGNILFKVYNNDKFLGEKIVLANDKAKSFKINVSKNDNIKIIIDKNGVTSADWGEITLYKINNKNIFIALSSLLLWLFILFLSYKKNHSSIVIAFYFIFILFIFAEKYTFNVLEINSIIAHTSFFIPIVLLITILYSISNIVNVKRILTILTILITLLFSIIPLVFISYKMSLGIPLNKEELFAIFQSNFGEGIEFISEFINVITFVFFTFSLLFLSYIIFWHRKSVTKNISFTNIFALILTTSIIMEIYFHNLKIFNFINSSFNEYMIELNQFKELQNKRQINPIKAQKNETGETYIFIIGESQNKNHMQMYGYPRDTTPKLQELLNNNEIIRFDNIYSNHTHTMPVLSLALTEASQYNNKSYFESASIIEIFNAANFETVWLTNQNLLGAWDNLVSIIANQASSTIGINKSIGETTKTNNYDGDLIPYLSKELNKKSDKNRAIFIHLMGNHGHYCSRFPKDFEIFKGDLEIDVFGKSITENKNLKDTLNCYDNSILYNDSVVSNIINEIKNYRGVNALIYMADHADDVIGQLGHNSGKLTFDMTQIPMFAYFSDEYKHKHQNIYNGFIGNKEKLFSNDMFYDTLIGLTNIKANLYNPKYDLTSKDFELKDKDAKTLHGRREYIDQENTHYWQNKNLKYLKENNLDNIFFPHKVNSVGKLKDAFELGFKSFEIDLVFDYKNDGKFYVGHNRPLVGLELEKFLKSIDYKQINRMWFDFKNLNDKNKEKAKEELSRLDSIFNLKDKIILETSWTSKDFNIFSQDNWHTSYYLPTEEILELLKKNDNLGMEKLSLSISKQIKDQKVSAVSFDTKLYKFVKNYLENKISNDIVYHAWYGPAINSKNYLEQINNEIYRDGRIKTFLSSFSTKYNL